MELAQMRIDELEREVETNPDDSDAWYELGMAYHKEKEWMRAYECFQNAEVAVYNKMGDKYKSLGSVEASQAAYRKAQKIDIKPFTLAPAGSQWLRNFLLITGIIAIILAIPVIALWFSLASLLFLIFLLFDFLVFTILLPIAIVKHIGSRKKSPKEFLFKIQIFTKQIDAITNNPELTEGMKFIQIERIKQKRARAAQEAVRWEYTESISTIG